MAESVNREGGREEKKTDRQTDRDREICTEGAGWTGEVYRKSEKQKQKERIVITRMRKRDGVYKHGKRNCEATKIVLIDLFKMKIKRAFCLAKF